MAPLHLMIPYHQAFVQILPSTKKDFCPSQKKVFLHWRNGFPAEGIPSGGESYDPGLLK